MGEISILTAGKGDVKVIWDPENKDEVALAEKQFDDAMEKGFTAFRVKKGGKKSAKITEFDPDAEQIILVPQIAGG